MTLRQGRVIGTTGHTLTGTHGIADIDQPQRQAPLDLDAIAAWNAANKRAREECEAHPIAACDADDCPRLARVRWCRIHKEQT